MRSLGEEVEVRALGVSGLGRQFFPPRVHRFSLTSSLGLLPRARIAPRRRSSGRIHDRKGDARHHLGEQLRLGAVDDRPASGHRRLPAVRYRFVQLRRFPEALRSLRPPGAAGARGTLSPFQAFMTGLGASTGTGNIAGVATAIVTGGPGRCSGSGATASSPPSSS